MFSVAEPLKTVNSLMEDKKMLEYQLEELKKKNKGCAMELEVIFNFCVENFLNYQSITIHNSLY